MLFNFSKQKHGQSNAKKQLSNINSDGIHLSINELIPYQNKISLINLTPTKSLNGRMSGNYLARTKGRGMEFDEVRHYQAGDDIRAIDWRVTARTGKTHTKLFREEVERPVLIATDLTDSMLFGSQLLFKSIQAAHLAALVAWHAKGRGDRIGGIVFNQEHHHELKPRSRKEGVLHYIHSLVQLHKESIEKQFSSIGKQTSEFDQNLATLSFQQNCARVRQLARPGSLVYLITDGHNINDEAIRHFAHISRHCELLVCLISDPLEHQLPQSSQKLSVAVTNGKTRQVFTLGDKKTSQQYKDAASARSQNIKKALEKSGARLLTFDAGSSLESQLKNEALS